MEPDDHEGQENGIQTRADGPAPQDSRSGGATQGLEKISRRRLIGVDALITLTTVLLVVGIFSVWANRLLFSPDNWSKTSTQLLQHPKIRSSTANYIVDQLYDNVNVAALLRSGLPPALQPLAAPAAGALRNAAVQGTDLALTRPRVQNLWAQANRAADQSFVAIVNGKGPVGVNRGAVTLNLGAIVNNVAARLGLPSGLSSKLPANVANLTVIKSDQLKYVQNGGKAIKSLALWLFIIVPLLYVLAVFLARGHRRRTLMTIGLAGVFAGVFVLLVRSILENQVAGALTSDASLQETVRAVYVISTAILSDVAGAVIAGGLVLVAAAWFAGPASVARTARQAIAPFLRERPVAAYAIALGVMVLIFVWNPIPATGKPAGIIVFTLLALLGTEVLIRQTAQEFPDARPGAAKHAIRARVQSTVGRREPATSAAAQATTTTVPGQLADLAALRDSGAITAEEFQSAKAALLQG